MAVPSSAYPVLQMAAIARVENLRRHGVLEVNAAIDGYADTHYTSNAGLTGRERICRLANQLTSIKDLAREVKDEINGVVTQLRLAFKLQNSMERTATYGLIIELLQELDRKYPVYDIDRKLRLYNRFVSVHGVAATKAEAAQMVSELLVIGMNADGEGFRADLEQTIQKMTKVMLIWM